MRHNPYFVSKVFYLRPVDIKTSTSESTTGKKVDVADLTASCTVFC